MTTPPVAEPAPVRLPRRLAVPQPLAAVVSTPRLLTWLGLAVAAGGLAAIVVGWGRTAALTNVGLQLPYVISAGFTGLALVVLGALLVSLDARHADARERLQLLHDLEDSLLQLRRELEERS